MLKFLQRKNSKEASKKRVNFEDQVEISVESTSNRFWLSAKFFAVFGKKQRPRSSNAVKKTNSLQRKKKKKRKKKRKAAAGNLFLLLLFAEKKIYRLKMTIFHSALLATSEFRGGGGLGNKCFFSSVFFFARQPSVPIKNSGVRQRRQRQFFQT